MNTNRNEKVALLPINPMDSRRIQITLKCKDTESLPRVPGAGGIYAVKNERYQLMHNGIKVIEDGYIGPWVTELIRLLKGFHEPQEEKAFAEILNYIPAQATMLELGSWWSYYSLWFQQKIPGARNYMIEPDINNMMVGMKNFELNKMNGHHVNAAIGRKSIGPIPYRCYESDNVERPVPVYSVDFFLEQEEIQLVDLLLADIQGYELEMLQGATRSIQRGAIRFLVISTHHHTISHDPLIHQKCLEFLKIYSAKILVEHTISESYSGDGLIVASLFSKDQNLPTIEISRNFPRDNLFRETENDLSDVLIERQGLATALEGKETERERLEVALNAKEAERGGLVTVLEAKETERKQLEAALNAKETERQRLELALNAKEAERGRLVTVLEAKETERKQLEAALNAKEAERQRLELALNAKETEKQELAIALEAKEPERQRLELALNAKETEKQELAIALEAKEAERQRLELALNAKETEKQEFATALEAKEAEGQWFKTVLNAKEAERKQLKAALRYTQAKQQKLETILNAKVPNRHQLHVPALYTKEVEWQRLEAALDAKEVERRGLDTALNAKEADRQRLESALRAKDAELQRLVGELNAKEVERQGLDDALNAKEANRQKLEIELNAVKSQLDIVQVNRDLVFNELIGVYHSRSFRLTRPLRLIFITARKWRDKIKGLVDEPELVVPGGRDYEISNVRRIIEHLRQIPWIAILLDKFKHHNPRLWYKIARQIKQNTIVQSKPLPSMQMVTSGQLALDTDENHFINLFERELFSRQSNHKGIKR